MNRTLLLGSAWTGSAAAAVGLGFLAVSFVDASASPAVRPVSTSISAGAEDTSSPTPTSSAPPNPTGQQATVAGTVFANCAGGTPVLGQAPAAGWSLDDSLKPGQVEFTSAGQQVEVTVACVGGSPKFTVEGPRARDRSGADDGSPTPAAPSSDAPDDSDGRVGGGHGADDPAGDDNSGGGSSDPGPGSSTSGSGGGSDDSSGRGGGGHGSDD
jgi:hypothetical protein